MRSLRLRRAVKVGLGSLEVRGLSSAGGEASLQGGVHGRGQLDSCA